MHTRNSSLANSIEVGKSRGLVSRLMSALDTDLKDIDKEETPFESALRTVDGHCSQGYQVQVSPRDVNVL